jgi:hypothetical protein|tara:strand:- start:726 stop:968 length:243 start_codon:yes stop_codon:yes gene_type:complete
MVVVKEDMDRIKDDRGSLDLTRQIDDLKKQKEYLQRQCRKAGAAILKQEGRYVSLEKEYDKVCEERDNFERMLKNREDTE